MNYAEIKSIESSIIGSDTRDITLTFNYQGTATLSLMPRYFEHEWEKQIYAAILKVFSEAGEHNGDYRSDALTSFKDLIYDNWDQVVSTVYGETDYEDLQQMELSSAEIERSSVQLRFEYGDCEVISR
ncbi:MAG: hypothetical protein O9296_11230 [Novosphingobium sp.]|jgi:hypothetical protein|nr:hypothetical protein [Novosphingobium sp.]